MRIDDKSLNYLSRYMEVTETVKRKIIEHCKKYHIKPEICAWYEDMEDFYSDWCDEKTVGLMREEAHRRYTEGKESGEFKRFANGEIIRFEI